MKIKGEENLPGVFVSRSDVQRLEFHPPLSCYHFLEEELLQPWETVSKGTDEWFNQHSLFPMKDGECTCRIPSEKKKKKRRVPLIKSKSDGKSWQNDFDALALWWVHKSRTSSMLGAHVKTSVYPWSSSRIVFSFADCDINGDDHCLLGVIECAMCNAAILPLIHHCHASV